MTDTTERRTQVLLMTAFVCLAGCGGQSKPQGVDGGAVDGNGAPSDSGGHQDAADAQDDGASIDDGSTDATCNTDDLWRAVSDAALGVARLGSCAPAVTASSSGQIVLDSTGRVIDNTGTTYQSTSSKQAWLDSLANDRWPCLAGQTIPYQCVVD